MDMRNNLKTTVFLIPAVILLLLLSSCSARTQSHIQQLTNSISYLELPQDYTFNQVLEQKKPFNQLDSSDMANLTGLMEDTSHLLWLKIDFYLDEELKDKQVGLFIGHLRSATHLYINNSSLKEYGNMPPEETTSGFQSQYYMFPDATLNREGKNTIYIQVWPGSWGTLSSNIFLSEQQDVFNLAERTSFFNSRITLIFTYICLVISFIYFTLAFVLRKYEERRMYLSYGCLNLYTSHFLLAFCLSELPWLKIPGLSYLAFLKYAYCYGGFSTIYWAVSFIKRYLKIPESNKIVVIRFVLWAVDIIVSCCMPTYTTFIKAIPYLLILALVQFAFCIPQLIKQFFNKKTCRFALNLIIGFSPVIISVIVDLILIQVLNTEDLPYITLYGWQITIYLFLFQLLRKFGLLFVHNSALNNQLQEFNENLEQVVALRTKELSDANYVLSKGLETVSHVQRNFLPPKEHLFRGWDLAILYKPLDNNVSGDLYDYYSSNSDTCLDGLGIFDVSGHGIPAGLMTILAKGIISQQFLTGIELQESISEVLEEINKTYIREKVNIDNYITGLLFRFSEFNKKDICSVEFANAGHPYPLFYSAKEDKVSELKYEDPDKQYGIIGVEGLDVSFPPVSFRMGPDDIILCYTDGLTEATNNQNEDFSKKRVIDFLKENKDLSSKEIIEKLSETLLAFTDNKPLEDDITIIALKRNNSKDYIEEI